MISIGEPWDVMHDPGDDDAHWSTDNVGEAAPGVLTPFSWSMWRATGDGMPRRIAYLMGVFSREDLEHFPEIVRPFYGRLGMRMEYLATVGDRMPGASGAEVLSGYSRNLAVLHTDEGFMPRRRSVWSSWNYTGSRQGDSRNVSVTYWMNRLQTWTNCSVVQGSARPESAKVPTIRGMG